MVKAAALALLLLPGIVFAADHPRVVLDGDRVQLILPDSILEERGVRKQLDSALTTTFIVKTRFRGTTIDGGARIEIRYDLWDEVFLVKRFEAGARAVSQKLANAAQLEQWWRTPLTIARMTAERATVDIELIVLPFSVAEESDARQWLSKSGGASSPTTDRGGIVDVLIGTTLTARPILSRRWSAELVRK